VAREYTYSITNTKEEREIVRSGETVPKTAMMTLTIDEQAEFLDLHPGWSPLLNEEAAVAGFQGPSGLIFALEYIASFLTGEPVHAMPAITVVP
jgi:hypothetical protein